MGCCRMTKRDVRIFLPSFIALYSSAYSITMLFPFLPFMIEFLLPQVEEEDIGKYAGFIASSMFFGRFFGSYVWGAVSDKKGRKPVVIVSCLLIGVSSAAFGFSVRLYMAIIFRFMIGLFNGVVGTVKAIVSESSNNRTQALGMTLIMCAFSFGLITGPAISGALADPIGQYNLNISNPTVRGFLTKFPFSLPCIVNAIICVIAAVVVTIWMPETLGAKKSENRSNDGGSERDDEEELLPQSKVVGEEEEEDDDENNKESSFGVKNNTPRVETISNRLNGSISIDEKIDDQNMEIECLERGITDLEDHQKDSKDSRPTQSDGKRKAKRRGSLIPFFNRRSSFTPSFFKPAHSLQRSRESSRHLRSLHSDRRQLIFEEEEAEREGGGEGEEEEVERKNDIEEHNEKGGEGTEVEKVKKLSSALRRFGQTLKKTLLNLKLFMTTRETVLSLIIYCIFSFAVTGYDEVYSLWAAAAPHLGGLGWTLHEIGISQAISGLLFLPFSFIFPVLERRFGLINVYQMSCTVTILCLVMLPTAHLIPADSLNPLRWFIVILLVFISRVTIGSIFAATALFINNSVMFSLLGEVNGLAHSLTAALRSIGPVFAGTIFSISLSKGARDVGFPIDYHLIFIIFGLILLCCIILAAALPTTINRQKVVTSSSASPTSVSSESINRHENSSSSLIHTRDDLDNNSSTHETKL